MPLDPIDNKEVYLLDNEVIHLNKQIEILCKECNMWESKAKKKSLWENDYFCISTFALGVFLLFLFLALLAITSEKNLSYNYAYEECREKNMEKPVERTKRLYQTENSTLIIRY